MLIYGIIKTRGAVLASNGVHQMVAMAPSDGRATGLRNFLSQGKKHTFEKPYNLFSLVDPLKILFPPIVIFDEGLLFIQKVH